MLNELQPASELQQGSDPYSVRRVNQRHLVRILLGVTKQIFENGSVYGTEDPGCYQVGSQLVGPNPMIDCRLPESTEFVKLALRGSTRATAVGDRRQAALTNSSSDGGAYQWHQETVESEHETVCQFMSDPRVLDQRNVSKVVPSREKDQFDYVGSALIRTGDDFG
jgi:hypothetical protein